MTHALLLGDPPIPVDFASITDRLGGEVSLTSSAREHGAIARARKVKDGATLLRLVLMHGPGGLGLRPTAALAEIAGIVAMSDTALWKRLAGAADWVGHLCAKELRRWAPASICDSVAHATWGQPKPRNAVLGVVFDMTARDDVRTFGMRYGPAPT